MEKNVIFISMKRYKHNHEAFRNITTEQEAYWLGFLLADGSNYDNKDLRVDIKDAGHLEKLSKLIYTEDKPIAVLDHGFGAIYSFSCTIRRVVQNLNKHGVTPRKSKTAKLPEIQSDLYRHFIRGVFDGDGSLCYSMDKRYRRYTFSIVGTKELTMGIRGKMLRDTRIPLSHGEMKTIYRIYKRGNRKIIEIMDWLYKDATVYLERKHEKYQDMLNYYKLKNK